MVSLTMISSAIAGRAFTVELPGRSTCKLHQRTHQRIFQRSQQTLTKAALVDTGYNLADAAGKVADKAQNAVGSVNAPGWVLPVS